eukprot:COSAG01_NODE_2792_length_7061_cov_20.067222_3_plen_80_part_00
MARSAALALEQHVVFVRGWGAAQVAADGGHGGMPEWGDDRVFECEAAPHEWLFPEAAVVVHHGGAGTTARALWASTPSV